MSEAFSGQITRSGCATSPARTSSASRWVASTWLRSTCSRSPWKSRPTPGTLPCTRATVTGRPSPAPTGSTQAGDRHGQRQQRPASAARCQLRDRRLQDGGREQRAGQRGHEGHQRGAAHGGVRRERATRSRRTPAGPTGSRRRASSRGPAPGPPRGRPTHNGQRRQPQHGRGARHRPGRGTTPPAAPPRARRPGPMTVSQDSNGRKVARPWTRPSRAPSRARWPRDSRTRPATPSGASGHTSYGGSASATRAPLTAAPASRGPEPARTPARRCGSDRSTAAGPACPVAVLVTVVRVLPGVGRPEPLGRADTVSGLRRYNGREPAAVPMVPPGCGTPTDCLPRRRVRARTALRTDLVRPAAGSKAVVYWAVGPFPCLTPWVSPSLEATTAIGPGTRTALAHCAVPGPKPARVCRGGGFLAGVLWWTSLTLVLRRVPVNRLVTCADAQSRR